MLGNIIASSPHSLRRSIFVSSLNSTSVGFEHGGTLFAKKGSSGLSHSPP